MCINTDVCVAGLPPTPVQLLYPVSRFSNVKSLQHLCRFCIRQIVRIDHIQELPLPRYSVMWSCSPAAQNLLLQNQIVHMMLDYKDLTRFSSWLYSGNCKLTFTFTWRFPMHPEVLTSLCLPSPLCRPLISYLSKFYYYDPEEEMYLSIRSIRTVVGLQAESQT